MHPTLQIVEIENPTNGMLMLHTNAVCTSSSAELVVIAEFSRPICEEDIYGRDVRKERGGQGVAWQFC